MCEISEMHECDNLPTDTVQICKSNNILDVDGQQWIICVCYAFPSAPAAVHTK